MSIASVVEDRRLLDKQRTLVAFLARVESLPENEKSAIRHWLVKFSYFPAWGVAEFDRQMVSVMNPLTAELFRQAIRIHGVSLTFVKRRMPYIHRQSEIEANKGINMKKSHAPAKKKSSTSAAPKKGKIQPPENVNSLPPKERREERRKLRLRRKNEPTLKKKK